MKELILHIGSHKTGTSSIQKALRLNNAYLNEKGISVFRVGVNGHKVTNGNVSGWIGFNGIKFYIRDLSKLSQLISSCKNDKIILSCESFSWIIASDVIKAFHENLKKFGVNLKICCYLRRQDQQLFSHYLQSAKDPFVFEPKVFGTAISAFPEPNKIIDDYLDYNRRLGNWVKIIGIDNCTVRVYQRNKLKDEDVVSDFFDVLGLTYHGELINENSTWSLLKTALGHKLNSHKIPKSKRSTWFSQVNDSSMPRASLLESNKVLDRYKESNEVLNQIFNITFPDINLSDFSEPSNFSAAKDIADNITSSLNSEEDMKYNLCTVAQSGRLMYEALLLLISHNANNKNMADFYIAIPKNGKNWEEDPSLIPEEIIKLYKELGAKIKYFENKSWGSDYPYSNKFYALNVLPENEPFVFLDSDTYIFEEMKANNFDFDNPSGHQEGTVFPNTFDPLYSNDQIWKSIYSRFGYAVPKKFKDKFPYYNAGVFYYKCPKEFFDTIINIAETLWFTPHAEIKKQKLNPWLDQVSLAVTCCHLRNKHTILPSGINKRIYDNRKNKLVNENITVLHYHNLKTINSPRLQKQKEIIRTQSKMYSDYFIESSYFYDNIFRETFDVNDSEFFSLFMLDRTTGSRELNLNKEEATLSAEKTDEIFYNLRRLALEAENVDLNISLAIMNEIKKLRKNTPMIDLKISEYSKKLGV